MYHTEHTYFPSILQMNMIEILSQHLLLPGQPVGRTLRSFNEDIGNGVCTSRCKFNLSCILSLGLLLSCNCMDREKNLLPSIAVTFLGSNQLMKKEGFNPMSYGLFFGLSEP